MAKLQNPKEMVTSLRSTFQSGKTKSVDFRLNQLKNFKKLLVENQDAIVNALKEDLRKPRHESIIMEIEVLLSELNETITNLRSWVKPQYLTKNIVNILDEVCIYNDPYGVVLIVGAWNYPFQLTLAPVVGAIAAGNCIIAKPSELAPASAKLMWELFEKYMDTDCYQIYCGGIEETTNLLKEKFDYIFYTGSTTVGKIFYETAAKTLTPVTLELGGKSPVYVDNTADIEMATRRILWGKFANLGQTCIAPDYLMCTKDVEKKIIEYSKKLLKEWFGENPIESPDLGRIINERNFTRVVGLLQSGKTAIGGRFDASEKYIEPTILTDVHENDPVMREEIFGPILPILSVNNLKDVINYINKGEKPLAMYIFTKSKKDLDLLIENTTCGGICVNDTVMHFAVGNLPFGGVGSSGIGKYHGKHTYETFSHQKSCLKKTFGLIGEKLGCTRYPPFNPKRTNMLKYLLRTKFELSFPVLRYLTVFAMGCLVSFYYNRLSQ